MKPEPSPANRALEAAQAALAAEHAAAYGYGVIGARASAARANEAREAYGWHLARRDALARSVREMGGAPRSAEPAYALPYEVHAPADAERLAAEIEDRVAGAYSDLVRAADGRLRREAADALSAAAVRAARWRGVGVAFPGLTERAAPARTS
ncbi:ferritin-like domain-containing protein [Streptomyces sp. NPDC032472]|uniref:ferritin-like domain-containing protein n=1 Tax=Streptomyces sp. NPDC032472 TaxID=3155018 RepID=UPI0033ED6623